MAIDDHVRLVLKMQIWDHTWDQLWLQVDKQVTHLVCIGIRDQIADQGRLSSLGSVQGAQP